MVEKQNKQNNYVRILLHTTIQMKNYTSIADKRVAQLSQRDHLWPKVEDWNWETIFYGPCRSTFEHCDVIGQQSTRIR